MTKLRYTPPLDLEIEGAQHDLAAVEARIRALAQAGEGVIEILGDSTGSPAPYQTWLESLVIVAGTGALVASVDGNRYLNITGSAANLEILASYFVFPPDAPDGHHTHLEYHPGDTWIAEGFVPIVVCVRVPSRLSPAVHTALLRVLSLHGPAGFNSYSQDTHVFVPRTAFCGSHFPERLVHRFGPIGRSLLSGSFRALALKLILSVILPLSWVTGDCAQNLPKGRPLRTTPLAKNLYLISPGLNSQDGNVVVLCNGAGNLLSDTGLSREVPELQAAVAGLPCPNHTIKFVINTHWHLDHAGGNRMFAAGGAVIVAQDEARRTMSSSQKLMGSTVSAYPEIARPTITFSDRATVHLGDIDVIAEHYANAHTSGDAVVSFGGTGVMHIGDIYYGAVFPWVDADHGGSILGLRSALGRLLQQQDSSVFVPGHGEPITKNELNTMARLIDASLEMVRNGIARGLSLQQMQEKGVPKEWKSYAWEGMSESAWIEALYREMATGRAPDRGF